MNFTDLFEVEDRNETVSKCLEKLKGQLKEAVDIISKEESVTLLPKKESDISDSAKDLILAIEMLNPVSQINIQEEFNL